MRTDKLSGTFWRLRYPNEWDLNRVFVCLGRDITKEKHQYFLFDLTRGLGFWGTPSGWGDTFLTWFPGEALRSMDPDRDA